MPKTNLNELIGFLAPLETKVVTLLQKLGKTKLGVQKVLFLTISSSLLVIEIVNLRQTLFGLSLLLFD